MSSGHISETLRPYLSTGEIIAPLYHGTKALSATAIMVSGFKPSTGRTAFMGPGVYFWEGTDGIAAADWWIDKNQLRPGSVLRAKARVRTVLLLDSKSEAIFKDVAKFLGEVTGTTLTIGQAIDTVLRSLLPPKGILIDAIRNPQHANLSICIRNPESIFDIEIIY